MSRKGLSVSGNTESRILILAFSYDIIKTYKYQEVLYGIHNDPDRLGLAASAADRNRTSSDHKRGVFLSVYRAFPGMLIYTFCGDGNIMSAVTNTFDMMFAKISDNAYMIIFLALLWAVVVLVSKSGGSEAYGRWAGKKLKSKRSAAFATSLLGVLIFIDDGFNCLTVGTVMRPITDRLHVSREKLAYLIDATAAPICIIAPVSSWAVAVASEVSRVDGFHVFLSTIPYNFYALLTIAMVFLISFSGKDFGPMKKAELLAEQTQAEPEETQTVEKKRSRHRPCSADLCSDCLCHPWNGVRRRILPGRTLFAGDRRKPDSRPDARSFRRSYHSLCSVYPQKTDEAESVH